MTGSRRLVLVVDADAAFCDRTREALQGVRVVEAATPTDAATLVVHGTVDLVIAGPSFGTESAVATLSPIVAADPGVAVALAADIVTNRVLRAALKAGFVDVLDTPVTARDVASALARVPERLELPPVHEAAEPVVGELPAEPAEEPDPEPAPEHDLEADTSVDEPADQTPPADTVTGPERIVSVSIEAAVRPDVEAPVSEPAVPREADGESSSASGVSSPAEFDPIEPEASPQAPPDDPGVGDEGPALEDPSSAAQPPPAFAPPPPPPPPEEPAEDTPAEPVEEPEAAIMDFEEMDILQSDASPLPDEPRVVAVMAGKGGSGKTVTAVNVATAMAFATGEGRTAIVDADLQFGDVALLLGVEPVRTIEDGVLGLDRMSDARLDSILIGHESGLRVLPAPSHPLPLEAIPAKDIALLVSRLRGMYDRVVVDTSPIFDDGLVTVLEAADDVLMVVDMDMASVKNAKVALDGLQAAHFPLDRILLILNRVDAKARLDIAEIERTLGLSVAGSIPSERSVPQSVNEGIPVVALQPRARAARAFQAIAGALLPATKGKRRRRS